MPTTVIRPPWAVAACGGHPCACKLSLETRRLSIPFDRAPHGERRALLFMTGSEASDINQRLDAPTQASPSRLRNGQTVKQRSRTYKDMKNVKIMKERLFFDLDPFRWTG
jgi:hypothetical protein